MRTAVIVILIVVAMALGGWLTFSRTGDRASISLETQEIQKDTRQAVEKGQELIDKASEKVKDASDRTDDKR